MLPHAARKSPSTPCEAVRQRSINQRSPREPRGYQALAQRPAEGLPTARWNASQAIQRHISRRAFAMIRYGFGVLLAALVFSQPAQAQGAPAKPDAGSKELQATIDKYVATYNEGSVDQVMSHWTENADFVDIHGRFHEGRDLISALFRRGFANNPGRKLQLT